MTSRAIYCNPNYYLEAMKHKHPDVFIDWCCNELSHVLDFSGTESVGDMLKGTCELKYPKNSLKKVKGQKRKVTGGVFGAPLTVEGYCQAKLLIEFLKRHMHVEGIFRVPGNSARQTKLKEKIIGGDVIDLDTDIFTPHDVACVLKAFLGELPEPLLSDRQFQAHVQAAGLTYQLEKYNPQCSNEESIRKWREKRKQDHIAALTYLCVMLPSNNYKLLQELLDLLYLVAKEQSNNKMTAFNLGVMFAPHVLWPRYFTTEDVRDQDFVNKLNTGVEFMIKHAQKICRVPQSLLSKCEAYIKNHAAMKENVKAVESERTLPDAPDGGVTISIPQPASVCVRSRHTTEEALSKMYSDIQQMQPSAKRRKLMKNFAKNCHMPGTPNKIREDAAQFMRAKKHSRSKSFGGVIKKHVLGTPSKKNPKASVISPPKSEKSRSAKKPVISNLIFGGISSPKSDKAQLKHVHHIKHSALTPVTTTPPSAYQIPTGLLRTTNKPADCIASTPSHQKTKPFSQRLFSADCPYVDSESPKTFTTETHF